MSLNDPATIAVWSTRAQGGGIWAPGGIVFDGNLDIRGDWQHNRRNHMV